MTDKTTGYPSIDKPWLKYYEQGIGSITIPQCTVFEFLKKSCLKYDNEIALEYFDIKVSYRELFNKIDEVSKAIKAVGIKKGDIVSVCLPNIPEVVYLIYAINRIGAVANMLDVRCGENALKPALIDAHSKLLICLDSISDRFSHILKETEVETAVYVSAIESFRPLARFITKKIKKELAPKVSDSFISWSKFIKEGNIVKDIIDQSWEKDANSYIAYTGGTTGVPKGVIATNENIIAQYLIQSFHGHNVGHGDRALVIAPPWTYYGLCNSMNNCLCAGMTLILIPVLRNEEFGATILKTKATYIVTVPAALLSIMEENQFKNADYSFINTLVVGADRLDENVEIRMNDYLKSHGCKSVVQKGYGMTEVMAASACTKKGADAIGSVGIPCPGVIMSAFNEENGNYSECKTGEKGEIAIQSPTLMKGYFGFAEKETTDILKRHDDGSLWAHTGDIGYVGEDGRIYIVGRIKRMFTRNGYKIFPATIENCIMKHHAVEQAAVVSVKDKVNGNVTKAYVVKSLSSDTDNNVLKNELSALTADELYEYEIPDIYEFVDNLPLTGMGKIDYKELEKRNQ